MADRIFRRFRAPRFCRPLKGDVVEEARRSTKWIAARPSASRQHGNISSSSSPTSAGPLGYRGQFEGEELPLPMPEGSWSDYDEGDGPSDDLLARCHDDGPDTVRDQYGNIVPGLTKEVARQMSAYAADLYFERQKKEKKEKKEKKLSAIEIIRRDNLKCVMLALEKYKKTNDCSEYEFEGVRGKTYIFEGIEKAYQHYNFTAKIKTCDSASPTSKLFFAETSLDPKDVNDVDLCCILEPNDDGICYGCKNQGGKHLKHPAEGGYQMADPYAQFPFLLDDSDSSEDDSSEDDI